MKFYLRITLLKGLCNLGICTTIFKYIYVVKVFGRRNWILCMGDGRTIRVLLYLVGSHCFRVQLISMTDVATSRNREEN